MNDTRLVPSPSPQSGPNRLLEGPAAWLITFILIPALLIAVLLLPPINFLQRLQAFAYTRINPIGGVIADSDGTMVNFPGEGIKSSFFANIDSIPRENFISGQVSRQYFDASSTIPSHLQTRSPFYEVDVRGTTPNMTVLNIPIPNDSLPYETLGIYTWTGERWQYLPSTVLVQDDIMESQLDYVPTNFMVMQTTSGVPSVTVNLGINGALPQDAYVAHDAKAGLYLGDNGLLRGTAPINSGNTLPIIRNWENEVVRTDLIDNLLLEPTQQQDQLASVEQTVVLNGYVGAVIDYRGVDAVPSARADFVYLMTQMAERLHAVGKTLAVRVEPPRRVSDEVWDTVSYDWRALGQVVDKLIVPMPADPMAYQPGGEAEALLRWSTSEVENRKLRLELSAHSVERSGNYLLLQGYEESLGRLMGEIKAERPDNGSEIQLTLNNDRVMNNAVWDDMTGRYRYSYLDDQGLERTVYIENADSLSYKLDLLRRYNISDISLMIPDSGDVDPNIWSVLLQFQNGEGLPFSPGPLAVLYNVYTPNNELVANEARPLEENMMVFRSPVDSGELRAEAQLMSNAGVPLSRPSSVRISLSIPAGTNPVPQNTAGTGGTGVGGTVTTDTLVNVRRGPTTTDEIMGQMGPDEEYNVIGQNGDWWQISYQGREGWVIDTYVDVTNVTNRASDGSFANNGAVQAIESAGRPSLSTDITESEIRVEESAQTSDVQPDSGRVTTDFYMTVRSSPNASTEALGYIAPGEVFEVVGKTPSGDWWQIDYNGVRGWLIDEFVKGIGDLSQVNTASDISEAVAFAEVVPVPVPAPVEPSAEQPVESSAEQPTPTQLPYVSPTPLPYVSPTPLPYVSPTPLPYVSPTPLPYMSPTPLPYVSPTPIPYVSPTPFPMCHQRPFPMCHQRPSLMSKSRSER